MGLDGFEMGLFITDRVAVYLEVMSNEITEQPVIDPEGKKRNCPLVGPLYLEWAGTLDEQEQRRKYPGAIPGPHIYEPIMAYVWPKEVILSPCRRLEKT